MNSRSTWTLVMIALGLFAFIYFFERHLKTVPPPPGPLLPGLSLSAITSIQVRPGDKADLIRVERTNGTWQLAQPVAYPAAVQRIGLLLTALHSLTRQRQIDPEQLRNHPDPQQEYGFDSPQFSLMVKQGEVDHTVRIGHTTRQGDDVFVQLVGATEIFLVDADLLRYLPRSPDDWRDRELLSLDEKTLDRLAVTNGNRVMVFTRDATNRTWRMEKPLDARADSARIDKYLRGLLDLRITKFVNDDPGADFASYGLRPPQLELALSQGTNAPLILSFGHTNESGQVHVRRREPAGVALVPSLPVESWKLPHLEFRDQRLVALTEDAVDRVEVRGEGAFTLECLSNGLWRVTAPESFPADLETVRLLLGEMNKLRIVKFVKDGVNPGEAQPFGFEPPIRSFIFSRSDTNAPEGRRTVAQLDFGKVSEEDREMVYVRRADESPIHAIRRTQMDRLPIGGWELRDRTIWNFTTNDVSKITVRHDGKVMEVMHEPTGRWTLGSETRGATNHFNSLAVEITIDSLGRLKAQFCNSDDLWRDHGAEAPLRNGITDKSMSIEVELRGEPAGRKLKVDLQLTGASECPLAATTLDGQVFVFAFPFGTFIQILNCLDPAPSIR